MSQSTNIKLFEDKNIRTLWDEVAEKWYFSVVDVVGVLADNPRPRKYWNDLKRKLKEEGSELSEKIGQLKLQSADGKFYMTDARREIETKTGKPIITGRNAKKLKEIK